MFSETFKKFFCFYIVTSLFVSDIESAEHRDINFELNPDCVNQKNLKKCTITEDDCKNPWVMYGRGNTTNNAIHYMWGFQDIPTFVMMTTDLISEPTFDWCGIIKHSEGAIYFNTSTSTLPSNLFGFSFQNLILFDDANDTGKIDNIPAESLYNISLSEFKWTTNNINETNPLRFSFESTEFQDIPLENDTKIVISVTSFEKEDRSDSLPHLITTPSSSQMNIILDNLILPLDGKILNGFNKPRWALDMIIIANEAELDEGLRYTSHKSLDDEYTPGVFDLISVTDINGRKPSSTVDLGGYLQWKPVCYLDTDENINYSTYPNIQRNKNNSYLPDMDKAHIKASSNSLFNILFGKHIENIGNKAQTIISFGLTGDKFYTEFNYTKWTLSMGLGSVPEESFSSLVIVVICVGIGIPILMFIASAGYFGIKKMRRGQNDTTALITDDEEE